ncbi:MAG: RNA-binding S4 domain-containing protein [Ruminococcaceae bacterium]|nr:RNA-binding S4 domain-containing protein [Oscillospiraceae bacterium]
MRLDKYLKISRIIKRRTVANDACDAGHVSVNGKVARASCDVCVGDVIEVAFGERRLKVKVLEVKETVGKNDAASLYEVIS